MLGIHDLFIFIGGGGGGGGQNFRVLIVQWQLMWSVINVISFEYQFSVI